MLQVHKQKSVDIYRHLMNGRILNRQKLNNAGEWVDDELFQELISNIDEYRSLYQACGFELMEHSDYVYLNDPHLEGKTELSMKAYCLLLIIGKYLTHNGFSLSKITSPTGGLTVQDFQNMLELDDVQELVEKAQLYTARKKDDFFSIVKNILVERHILLEKPSQQMFILSPAGRLFFDELLQNIVN